METLPPEMVAEIGQYLPAEDLARCCAVSVLWRDVFGCDKLWRPHCEADSEDHLRTTPCLVEPKFIRPESADTTLSSVGRWRALYMRENHLRRNWIQGNCIDEVTFSCDDVYFLNNDFVLTASENAIRLIDTTVMPPACVSEFDTTKDPRYRLPLFRARVMRSTKYILKVVSSDMFITLIRGNTIQVVTVDWESYAMSLKHTFCVKEGEEIPMFAVVGTYFVVFNNNVLRIWDVEKATKVEAECPMEDDGDGEPDFWAKLRHDRQCENMALIVLRNYGLYFHCFVYNVKDLRFWPFTKKSRQKIFGFDIVDQFVALYMDSLEIYNYQTSQLLYDFKHIDGMATAIGNSFLFMKLQGHEYEGSCTCMSPKRIYELVQLCPETGVLRYLGPPTSGLLYSVSGKLLHVVSIGDDVESETWMVTKTSTFQVSSPQPRYINQACTKLLYVKGSEYMMACYW